MGKPYIMENVGGARQVLRNPMMLCGTNFGLKVYRHRFFESNVMLFMPGHAPHHDSTPSAGHGLSPKGFLSVTSGGQGIKKPLQSSLHRFLSPNGFISPVGHFSQVGYANTAMGVCGYTQYELSQAYPPAYSEYLGRQLMQYVRAGMEAT